MPDPHIQAEQDLERQKEEAERERAEVRLRAWAMGCSGGIWGGDMVWRELR